MTIKVKLCNAKLDKDDRSYLQLKLISVETDFPDIFRTLATENSPYPSSMLKETARALYGKPLSFYGYFIWKGTPEDIEHFFQKMIGNECFYDTETGEMRSCHD